MSKIRLPERAVILFVGCQCSGKSTLARQIFAIAPSQNVRLFTYDFEMQDMITKTGLRDRCAQQVDGECAILTPEMLPAGTISQFNYAITAKMLKEVRRHDLTIVDGSFDNIENTTEVIQWIDSIREDRAIVLVKIAPAPAVAEQLQRMRKRDATVTYGHNVFVHFLPGAEEFAEAQQTARHIFVGSLPKATEYLVENPFTTEFVFT